MTRGDRVDSARFCGGGLADASSIAPGKTRWSRGGPGPVLVRLQEEL